MEKYVFFGTSTMVVPMTKFNSIFQKKLFFHKKTDLLSFDLS